jgi:hypothetical protein
MQGTCAQAEAKGSQVFVVDCIKEVSPSQHIYTQIGCRVILYPKP